MNLSFIQFRKFKKMNIHNEKQKNENERSKPEYETENENRLKVHKNRRRYCTYLCIEIRKRLCYSVTTINVAKKEMKRFKRTA